MNQMTSKQHRVTPNMPSVSPVWPTLLLDKWMVGETPPWTKPQLLQAIYELQIQTQPSDEKFYLVQINKLAEFATAFGADIPDPTTVTAVYRETLRDLPADLLVQAIAHIKKTWRGRNLPKPAHLLNPVEVAWSDRKVALIKARMALKRLPAPRTQRPSPNPAEIDRIMAKHHRFRSTYQSS